MLDHIQTTYSPFTPSQALSSTPGPWLGGLAVVTLLLFLVCGMGEGQSKSGERRIRVRE